MSLNFPSLRRWCNWRPVWFFIHIFLPPTFQLLNSSGLWNTIFINLRFRKNRTETRWKPFDLVIFLQTKLTKMRWGWTQVHMAEKETFIYHHWPTHVQHLFRSSTYRTRLYQLSIPLKGHGKPWWFLIFGVHEKKSGGTPMSKGRGCSWEILKRNPKRYQDPILWAWVGFFF